MKMALLILLLLLMIATAGIVYTALIHFALYDEESQKRIDNNDTDNF